MLDANLHSNVGCYDLPVRHGLTLGEMAKMANAEQHWNAKLEVIRLENWRREDWFDALGQPWVDPSPNMRSLNAATLYPGIALLETQKAYSVGRGTDAPFEQIGAEWIVGEDLAAYLNARNVPGIRVYAVRFQPKESIGTGKQLSGVRFVVTDREAFDAVRFGLEVAGAIRTLYTGKLDPEASRNLIGNRAVLDALRSGEDPTSVAAKVQASTREFLARRRAYLLY